MANAQQNQPNLQAVIQLLNCLTSMQLDNVPLRKYRYPSPGSLYPVQVYVQVQSDKISGIAGGTYYLDPTKAQLIALAGGEGGDDWLFTPSKGFAQAAKNSAFALVLVAKMSAIQPIYGALSDEFCLIEAGAMVQLLNSQAAGCNISLSQVDYSPVAGEALAKVCQLAEKDNILCTLLACPEVAQFSPSTDPDPDAVVVVKLLSGESA